MTIGGLTGTDMVPGVAKVVDCIPSPCLSVGGANWDRAHGRLVVTVQAGQELGAGMRLVMTLLTRNPRHTQPPVAVYVEAGTEYRGQAVKSLSPTATCPQHAPPLADPRSPAAAAVTDASSCTPPGAEAVASAPGISAPLFVRIWEMVRLSVRAWAVGCCVRAALVPYIPYRRCSIQQPHSPCALCMRRLRLSYTISRSSSDVYIITRQTKVWQDSPFPGGANKIYFHLQPSVRIEAGHVILIS